MRRLAIFFLFYAAASLSYAQSGAALESAVFLMGASSPEDADAEMLEHVMSFLDRPLKLNCASVEAMTASGLLTLYQALSLTDYRERHGEVLSLTELAAIDGFGPVYAGHLKPFISLETMAYSHGDDRFSCDVAARAGTKLSEDERWSYGMKVRTRHGERLSAAFAASSAYKNTTGWPDQYATCISYRFRSLPVRILAGDFNARFGQGLALWNGMSMSGVSTPESFMRNPGGISETWSFSGSSALTGIAADMTLKRLKVSAFLASPGVKEGFSSLMPAVNLSFRGRSLQSGITHYCRSSPKGLVQGMKTSADFAACIRGTDVFAEMAYDWVNRVAAGVAGVIFPLGNDVKAAAMVRCYPEVYDSEWCGAVRSRTKCSNEHSATAGCSFRAGRSIRKAGAEGFGADVRRHTGVFSIDAACLPSSLSPERGSIQAKLCADWTCMVSGHIQLRTKVTERLRTWDKTLRSDIRADVTWFSSRFTLSSRINAVKCMNTSAMAYVEAMYRVKGLSVYLRQGIFMADEWEDRIYVYERDAAGSFNVPALYGRGVWTSFYGSWRFSSRSRLDLRASFTDYPLMKNRKPGKAELKVQYAMSF